MISENSCVRPPAASPSAVRLPLELTGKPCATPAAALHNPRARSSALASKSSPLRAANVRAVKMLSENATIAMPHAGITSDARSCIEMSGIPGFGNPLGICPTTAIPLESNENSHTAAVAARTAISGPGVRGNHRSIASSATRTAADSAIVGQ